MLKALTLGALTCVISACNGATNDPGLDLPMRVRGAQLVRRAMPEPKQGPAITAVDVRTAQVHPGEGLLDDPVTRDLYGRR